MPLSNTQLNWPRYHIWENQKVLIIDRKDLVEIQDGGLMNIDSFTCHKASRKMADIEMLDTAVKQAEV
jgi:hypothetical protein